MQETRTLQERSDLMTNKHQKGSKMGTQEASLSAHARSWNKAMTATPGELDLTIGRAQIEGAIPGRLYGTRMLSNGPGWNKIGRSIVHPFDGHGYLRSFSFGDDGSVRLRATFVQTEVYKEEKEAGELTRRGLATNLDKPFWANMGFRNKPRNVANTTIVRWKDRLLAGWEGGAPYALDADSLVTKGEEHFGGLIAGQATLAHMKHDALQDRLLVCNIKLGRESGFTFRELNREEEVVATTEVQLPGMLFTHDFAITPSYYILGGNPLQFKPFELLKMLTGTGTLLRAITPDKQKPGVLHLIPRDGKGAVRTISLPEPTFVVHFGNAYESEGSVMVDACAFRTFALGEEFGYTGPHTPFDPGLPEAREPQRLLRITIPPHTDEATWVPLTEHGVDFPRFHPDHEGQETSYLFGATRKDIRYSDPFDSVIGVDLMDQQKPQQLWTTPENVFVGEPLFVPDPVDAKAGHILTILSDGLKERSHLAIFEAQALDKGPIATVPMPLLPIAFHGTWDELS